MSPSSYLVDMVADVTNISLMHETDDAREAPQGDGAPEEGHGKQQESAEGKEAVEQQDAEQEQGASPFGSPGDADDYQKLVFQTLQSLIAILNPILSRRSVREAKDYAIPRPPQEQVSMPKDLAFQLLSDLYKPKADTDNRQFRVGMGIGSAINMMGVQVLSQDLMHMMTAGVGNLFGKNEGRQKAIADILRMVGTRSYSPPGMVVPRHFRAEPPEDFDPIAGFEDPHYYRMPEGTVGNSHVEPARASGEGLGFAGIPPMPDIGPQMKEEMNRRWERKIQEDPEGAERMHRNGFSVDEIFNHFEDLFGEFFPSKKIPPEDKPEDK